MKSKVKYIDLGLVDYKKAWDYQEKLHQKLVNKKLSEQDTTFNATTGELILCEHPHVYTLGKSGQKNNLLIKQEFLNKIDATYYESNRGGDITYHGPGQIVGYPILDLDDFGFGIKNYIANLEETIIRTLQDFQIKASRLEGATGVWLEVDTPGKTRKICAMGVRVSRGVTMHGFAFNANTNLQYFSYINPCGFQDKGVTSLEKELGKKTDLTRVKEILLKHFSEVFQSELHK